MYLMEEIFFSTEILQNLIINLPKSNEITKHQNNTIPEFTPKEKSLLSLILPRTF